MSARRSVFPEPNASSDADARVGVGHTILTTAHVTAGGVFTTRSPQTAWNHFRPLAQKVSTEGLAPYRGDASLAKHNISVGLDAVEPLFPVLAARHPTLSIPELQELPALALAYEFAAERIVAAKVSEGSVAAHLRDLKKPRQDVIKYLEVAAGQELVPERRVRALREIKGEGNLKLAKNAAQAVSLFDEFADSLRGKHPFSADFLAKVRDDAEWLIHNLKPRRAARRTEVRSPESVERDQFAKLVFDRHEQLRVAGTVLFGTRDLDAKVPPLYSGTREASATDEDLDGETVEASEPHAPDA